MGLIELLLIVVAGALIVWASDTWLPGRPIFKKIIFWLAIIGVAWLILNAFGILDFIFGRLGNISLPRLHR